MDSNIFLWKRQGWTHVLGDITQLTLQQRIQARRQSAYLPPSHKRYVVFAQDGRKKVNIEHLLKQARMA